MEAAEQDNFPHQQQEGGVEAKSERREDQGLKKKRKQERGKGDSEGPGKGPGGRTGRRTNAWMQGSTSRNGRR